MLHSLRCALLIMLLSMVLVPSLRADDHLQVHGRFLMTPCGDTVVLRGVNKMCVFENVRYGITMMPEIRKTGANVVRIVWKILDDVKLLDTLDAVMQACIDNQMIPIVEMHDATGDWTQLNTVVQYWLSDGVKKVMLKHAKYAILNIANEAGDFSVTNEQYKTAYSGYVQQLRSAGYHMPLLIDADGYGQNSDVIFSTAAQIIDADPDKNVMFSLHAYWQPKYYNNPPALFADLISGIVMNQIPFMVGEFTGCYTDDPVSTDDLWKTILPQCQQHRIGWTAWEWGPGNADYSVVPPIPYPKMDMTADGMYATIKDGWSRSVLLDDANSIAKTSLTTDYIKRKGVCIPSTVATDDAAQVFVAPNPVSDQLTLHLDNISSVQLHTMLGATVLELQGSELHALRTLDVRMIPNGCYALSVQTADGIEHHTQLVVLHR